MTDSDYRKAAEEFIGNIGSDIEYNATPYIAKLEVLLSHIATEARAEGRREMREAVLDVIGKSDREWPCVSAIEVMNAVHSLHDLPEVKNANKAHPISELPMKISYAKLAHLREVEEVAKKLFLELSKWQEIAAPEEFNVIGRLLDRASKTLNREV